MKLNTKTLGALLLSTGSGIVQLAPTKEAWWVAFCMMLVGPILMAVDRVGTKLIGGSLLAIGMAVMSTAPSKFAWWCAIVTLFASPFMLSLERRNEGKNRH